MENITIFFVGASGIGAGFFCGCVIYDFIRGTSLEEQLLKFVGGDLEDDSE